MDEFDGFALHQIQQLPVRAEHIARETRKDEQLGKLVQLLEAGRDLTQFGYKSPESKYTLAANCLHFEHRVVIPEVLRKSILNDLHVAHLGVVKMKSLARSFVYWPGIDSDIEQAARSCVDCARHASTPPKFNSHHWEYPNGPWERIHVDYAGPVADSMLLIVVDAYSKWVEVKVTSSTTAAATINILDELFAAYGTPTTLVSDNGPQFTAAEFTNFLKMSGVKFHKLSAPYHPATNGQAERYVQTVKQAIKAMGSTKSTLKADINQFLRQFRKAAHSETAESPAKLFLGRNIRTRLDLVRPLDASTRITEKQKSNFNATFRSFAPGQRVYFLSGNGRMDKWIAGTIRTQLGDLHYQIDYRGNYVKRHVDQIRRFEDNNNNNHNKPPTTPTQLPSSSSSSSPPVLPSPSSPPLPAQHESVVLQRKRELLRRVRYYDTRTSHGQASDSIISDGSSQVLGSPDDCFSTPCGSPEPSLQHTRQVELPVPRRSERIRRPPLRFSP